MTDREAIEWLVEYLDDYYDELYTTDELTPDVANVCLSALQEREERSKGCEHCNNKKLPLEGGAHDFRILGNAIFYYDATFGWEGTTIGRCPWCGRWLEGEQDD